MRFLQGFFLIHLLLINYHTFANSESSKNQKIIIVGAGPSGIAAAAKSFENGFTNIILLEAENRIGGRAFTTKIGNYSVDLGGQWVFGQKDNVAYNMAYPLDLLDSTNTTNFDLVLLDSSGNSVSKQAKEEFSKFLNKYYVQGEVNQNTSAKSLGELIEQNFDSELGSIPEIMNDKAKYLHILQMFALSMDPAKSWYELAITDGDFRDCEGDLKTNWKSRGYGTILDILMKRYPDPKMELPIINNTLLNSEVTLIDYSNKNQSVKVTVKDGRIFEADHVIVTVSLGVLRNQHNSLFNPVLSDEKVKAMEGISFGGGGKVFLLFDEPFWQADDREGLYFGFLWNDAERETMEKDPEKMWLLGLTGAEPVPYKPNLLELYISSDYATVMESVPEDKVFHETAKIIEQFMGKIYNFSKPIAILRTQWHTNPHFRGTYTYHGPTSSKANRKVLDEPITLEYPKILFAGEATSQDRYGTVDGAIETGWAAAKRLNDLYKNQ